jgi:ParB-like chromosome segregation protein Spo0J
VIAPTLVGAAKEGRNEMNRLRSRENGFAVSRDLSPRRADPRGLRPLGEAVREHPPKQVGKIVRALRTFGFVYPVLVDEKGRVIAGWSLVLAAKQMGLSEIPLVTLSGLSEGQARMLRLALNRLAEDSSWDRDALWRELSQILEIENDLEITEP